MIPDFIERCEKCQESRWVILTPTKIGGVNTELLCVNCGNRWAVTLW